MSEDPRFDLWATDDEIDRHLDKRVYQEILAGKHKLLEERYVRKVVDYYQLPYGLQNIKAESRACTGEPVVSFYWFDQVFPTFPLTIRAAIVEKAASITLRNLQTKFFKTPIYAAYRQARDEAEEDEALVSFAMVFNWQPLGVTVLHDLRPEVDSRGLRVVVTPEGEDSSEEPKPYTLEPFEQLLAQLPFVA